RTRGTTPGAPRRRGHARGGTPARCDGHHGGRPMHAKPLISATVLLPLLAFGGCPSASDPAAPPTDASVASQECAPMVELEQLDPRTPLPLSPMMAWHQKQNMMEHLVAIQRITDGLARGDLDEIASASARIGASPEMDQTCSHMGAGAEGFTALA